MNACCEHVTGKKCILVGARELMHCLDALRGIYWTLSVQQRGELSEPVSAAAKCCWRLRSQGPEVAFLKPSTLV